MSQDTKRLHVSQLVMWSIVGVWIFSGTAQVERATVAVAQESRAAGDPHTPVSSDGSILPVEAFISGLEGEDSYEGTGEAAGDAFSEFAARPETAAEVWRLWQLRPATGKVGIETIIGPDQRVRINPTTTYPARAVVLITMSAGRCTGWMVSSNTVMTAGHCVHSGGPGGSWMTNVRVYPGRNGATSPFGSCSARRLHSVTAWTGSSNEQYDYGAIRLNCSVGNSTGWFGWFWQTATLTGRQAIIPGYPGDKPLTQWRSTNVVRVTQTRQIFYQNDTVGGMSGGPIYHVRAAGSPFCTGTCSMGIHAYGLHGSSPHGTDNHGTRITQAVHNNIVAWRNAP